MSASGDPSSPRGLEFTIPMRGNEAKTGTSEKRIIVVHDPHEG